MSLTQKSTKCQSLSISHRRKMKNIIDTLNNRIPFKLTHNIKPRKCRQETEVDEHGWKIKFNQSSSQLFIIFLRANICLRPK